MARPRIRAIVFSRTSGLRHRWLAAELNLIWLPGLLVPAKRANSQQFTSERTGKDQVRVHVFLVAGGVVAHRIQHDRWMVFRDARVVGGMARVADILVGVGRLLLKNLLRGVRPAP